MEAYLMVNVMIVRVIRGHKLQWIPRQFVSTVVVDSLESRYNEQHDGFACGETSAQFRDTRTNTVEYETLKRVVVQSAVCVRHVESVMDRVEGLIQPSVVVHPTVQEVFPCVDDEPKRS